MKKPFVFWKMLSLALVAILLVGSLTSCGEKTEQNAKTVVGTVDGNDIYYDELYALARLYASTAESADNPEEELDRLIRENILTNTAILRLCEQAGLTYDEEALADRVDVEITQMITDSFEGDEDAYRTSMTENGLTERYVRYSIGVELLYNDLLIQYPQAGLVNNTDESVRTYIEENFVHVYHLALFYDESNQAEKHAKMTEALEALRSGEKSMYDLIKAGYSEDFLDPSGNGYYVARGTMNEAYEEAAFALELNEVSDIVETTGTDNNGRISSCYYILQRFPMDEAYVDEHLSDLKNEYYSSVIYADLEEIRESLVFEPSSFYSSLTLSELLPPREETPAWVLVTVVIVIAVVLIGTVVVAVILIRRKPKRNKSVVRSK